MNSYRTCINVNFLIYRVALLRFGQFKGLDHNSFMLLVLHFFASLTHLLQCIWFVTDTWNCEKKTDFAVLLVSKLQVANSRNALNAPFIIFLCVFLSVGLRRFGVFFFPYFIARVHRLKIIIEFNLNGELPTTRFIFQNSRLYVSLVVLWAWQ